MFTGLIEYPIFFNTDETDFEFHREKAKKFRLRLKNKNINHNISSQQQTLSSASTITAPPVSTKSNSSNQSQLNRHPLSWSAVAVKSIQSRPQQNPPNKNAQPAELAEPAEPQQTQESHAPDASSGDTKKPRSVRPPMPSVPSLVEPLSVVLIRIMFQSNFVPKIPSLIKPRGLVNTGNICFMSSILQVLLYCSPFYNTLKVIEKRAQSSLGRQTTPLLDATLDFIEDFNSGQSGTGTGKYGFGAPMNPERFYAALSQHPKFRHFKLGQQEDAEEFLGYFLDGLHEEFSGVLKAAKDQDFEGLLATIKSEAAKSVILNTLGSFHRESGGSISTTTTEHETGGTESSGWHEVGFAGKKTIAKRVVEVKATPITQLFGGQFRSELEVPRTKDARSITLDPFQHVQLDISDPRVQSLETAFRVFAEPEHIAYKSSADSESMAKKQTVIDKLPKVLVIHLKRFLYISEGYGDLASGFGLYDTSAYGHVEKLKKRVSYSLQFDIPTAALSQALRLSPVSKSYKLTGVVYHHGTSTDVGHYTVDVLRPDKNTWIRIDDTKVEPITPDDVVTGDKEDAKSAYILIYERVQRDAATM